MTVSPTATPAGEERARRSGQPRASAGADADGESAVGARGHGQALRRRRPVVHGGGRAGREWVHQQRERGHHHVDRRGASWSIPG